MDIKEIQEIIRKTYMERDSKRGLEKTFLWFVEEIGEFSKAIREKDIDHIKLECSDVFAWFLSLLNLLGVDLEDAMERYKYGCPHCKRIPCVCPLR